VAGFGGLSSTYFRGFSVTEENQVSETEKKTRVRGPALETLADVRRQAKRLYAEFLRLENESDVALDELRMAASLLTLIKSTIVEEQAYAERAAAAKRREQAEADPKPPASKEPPQPLQPRIPDRFRVPNPWP
jgi:hypothetical protein